MKIDFNAMSSSELEQFLKVAYSYMEPADVKKVNDRIAFLKGWTNKEYRI